MLTFALPRTESPSIRLRAPNADSRGPLGAPGACRNPPAGRAWPGRISKRGDGESAVRPGGGMTAARG